MSKLGAMRKKWGYETNVPRCATCASFRPGRLVLRDSLPVARSNDICHDGGFTVRPNAVCDRWHNKAGDQLAK